MLNEYVLPWEISMSVAQNCIFMTVSVVKCEKTVWSVLGKKSIPYKSGVFILFTNT